MPISAIDHYGLATDNPERALDFYRRLGLKIVQQERGDRPSRPVIMIGEAQCITLLKPAPGNKHVPAVGGTHVCLVWDGTAQEVQEQLKRAGIPVDRGPNPLVNTRGPAQSFYLVDPDGNSVEITVYDRD
jgi:catechol 2,3-dioxygenase-like lactoylglutathione lyase family enzyme